MGPGAGTDKAELALGLVLGGGHLWALGASQKRLRDAFLEDPERAFSPDWRVPAFFSAVYLLVVLGRLWARGEKPAAGAAGAGAGAGAGAARSYHTAMVAYNVYQVALNVWVVFGIVRELSGRGQKRGAKVWGNGHAPSADSFNLAFFVWVHSMNKYSELADTMFMVVREKWEQVSFLHVYHHVLLLWCWAAVCEMGPFGDSFFGALCNSAIHVLMYSYYLLAALKVPCPWKRYLTQAQMLQFCVCAAHSLFVLWRGNAPASLPALQLFVMLNMLVLFGRFYTKKYSARRGGTAGPPREKAA